MLPARELYRVSNAPYSVYLFLHDRLRYDCEPAFSPDGLSMAFARGSSGGNRRDLFVLPVTGGEPKQLTFENSGAAPAWTQDGKEIVFSSDRGGLLSLWRISAMGGAPRPATGIGPMAFRPSIASAPK
jgi:Tol biopolymer transport system component